jgi:hypothetical protein
MENLIFHNGEVVGMDCGRFISWFSNATPEIIAALTG